MNDEVKVKVWTWKSHVTRHHTHHIDVMYSIFYHVVYIHTFYIVSVYFLRPPPRIDNPMLFHQKYIKIQSNSHKGIKKIYFYRTKTYFQYFFFVFSIFCQKTIKGSLVFSFLLLWIVWIVSTTIRVQQITDNSLSFLGLKHIIYAARADCSWQAAWVYPRKHWHSPEASSQRPRPAHSVWDLDPLPTMYIL